MTRRRPLPRSLRLAAALAVLVLPACGGGETRGAPAGTDWLVASGTDTTGAAAALGAFADGSVPAAFARLAGRPYRVQVTMLEVGQGAAPDTLGVFRRTLDVRPGAPPAVVSTEARGSLADTSGLDAARLLPRDPFPDLLPDDAPFLDRRTRGAYRLTTTPASRGPEISAEVADPAADRPLVRRATVRTRSGAGRTLYVARASRSAIYDETSAASVDLAAGDGGELPHRVAVATETGTPLRSRALRTQWRIVPAGAQPTTTNTREP